MKLCQLANVKPDSITEKQKKIAHILRAKFSQDYHNIKIDEKLFKLKAEKNTIQKFPIRHIRIGDIVTLKGTTRPSGRLQPSK